MIWAPASPAWADAMSDQGAAAQAAEQAASQARAGLTQAQQTEQLAGAEMRGKASALHRAQAVYDYAKNGAVAPPP